MTVLGRRWRGVRCRVVIAAYIRVSSRGQDLATQRAAIERAAAARGDAIDLWLAETRSARSLQRPELARLRELARRGEVSRLYVFRLDRLTRSGIRDTLELLNELGRANCAVINLADGFSLDCEGYIRELVLAMLAWAAQMERLALGERVSAARERVERSGGRWGRPVRVDASQAAEVLRRAAAGDSQREIAVALKIPRSTVQRILAGGVAQKGSR